MNQLNLGLLNTIEYPLGGFLLLADRVKRIKRRHPHEAVRVFDWEKHSLNVLEKMDYKKACDIAAIFSDIFLAGQNTLTKEGVPNILIGALLDEPESFADLLPEKSRDPSYISAQSMIRRVMRSPVL